MAAKKKSGDDAVIDSFVEAIKSGELDGYLIPLDDAITERSNWLATEETKKARAKKRPAAASASKEKSVSAPPKKKPAPKATVTPKEKGLYVVSASFKKLAGAKVEFQRFRNGDKDKAVVVMKTDKPGNPKGKRVVIPTSALEAVPAAKKTAAKKVAKKK